MYDSIAYLLTPGRPTYDAAGNEILTYTKSLVYVQPQTVYANEFYQAAQAGLHPEVTFVISNRLDYDGEKLIEWEGKTYNVIRVDWTGQRDAIRLVCEERIHNG